MAYFHKSLTQEKWDSLSKDKQILNIAAELLRAKNLLKQKDIIHFKNSLDRAFELIDLTVNDRDKWSGNNLKELVRLREYLASFYIKSDNSLEDFLNLIKSLLFFDKHCALVKI